MRKTPKSRMFLLVAVLALSLAASVLPGAAHAQQGADAQQVAPATIQVGENQMLRHDEARPTRARDSVGVAVNPNDPDHILMFNADLYEFLCEYHVSRDGGATWTSGRLTAPEGFGAPGGNANAPCVSIGHGTRSYDGHHAIAFGSDENVYMAFSSARYGQEDGEDFELSAMVAHSSDGGETFSTAVEAMPAGRETGEEIFTNRHSGIVAWPREGQPDRLVVAAYDATGDPEDVQPPPARPSPGLAVFAVSEDGGQTWSDREAVSDELIGGFGGNGEFSLTQDAGDGTVYVMYRAAGFEAELRVARSTDDGENWEIFTAGDVRGFDAAEFVPEGEEAPEFPCCNYPRASAGSDGDLYITYMEGPPAPFMDDGEVEAQDHFIHPDGNVFVVSSADHGETWTDPVRVNDPVPPTELTGNIYENQVRHPDVTVAPNGRVDVVWQDRRHWYRGCRDTHAACNEGRLGDTYWAYSTDGGQSFSEDVRVSDRTQNNEIGSDYRRGVWWDFAPQAVGMGNDELFVAWMDSRQGNFENDALDIYYAKVDLGASSAATTPMRWVPAADTAGDLSVALARHVWPGGAEATLTSTFATEPWTRLVVVNEDDHAAALAGSVLARAYLGPVLAVPAEGLTARLADEANRMDPIGAFVLGGTDAVGAQVESDLVDATGMPPAEVVRIDGTPADMAAAIAREMDWRTGTGREDIDEQHRPADAPAFPAAVITNPDTPDGVAAAALASNRRMPVLFVEQDAVPAATQAALDDLNIEETLVIGGTDSVGDGVMGDLPNATRLGGDSIEEVSQAVAEEALDRGLPANIVYVSDSASPMDAVLSGSAAGRAGGLQLMTADASTAAATTVVDALGVGDQVDRFIVTGGLETRADLTWACPDGEVPPAGFVDIAGNTHEGAIECAAWYGITEGGPGGLPAEQYGPALSVRRDQMASFIARKIDASKPGLLPPATGPNPFPGDLTEGNAHYDAIRRLHAAGVVLGLDENRYGPAQSVRRDQMASFIHRAIRFVTQIDEASALHRARAAEIVTDEVFFTDASPAHLDNVNALASEGIVLGVGGGQYAGANAVRRDQMASFVNRGLDFLVQHEQAHRPVLATR